jgi:hypothetical protein
MSVIQWIITYIVLSITTYHERVIHWSCESYESILHIFILERIIKCSRTYYYSSYIIVHSTWLRTLITFYKQHFIRISKWYLCTFVNIWKKYGKCTYYRPVHFKVNQATV